MTTETSRASDEAAVPLTPETQAEKIAEEAAAHVASDDEPSVESFPASDSPAP